MTDNLDKYLPEFDEEDVRAKLAGATPAELTDMLVYAYKEKRVWAKSLGEKLDQLSRIQAILSEPSALLRSPGIPSDDDLHRMMGEE